MTPDAPVWTELAPERAPSDEERRLLEWLAAAVDEPLLHDHVATAAVTAVCRCGCPSVRLRSAAAPIPEARVSQLSHGSRPDYFSVSAAGPAGVQVVLHVARGRLLELEVFAGEGVAAPVPDVRDLTDVTVS
ncbi:hypothetical protein DMO24_10995 [Modestobacter versicolor]|uniref:Uncharacterized protein n=1 Tax=Modestobacter versicolor TaxID=429133 RepID=A0A323V975_9ACTN|nr:hypothetical protein DMO24_10995 [Modestobacter versicolor]